jgi:flagellar motor switch protein FliM
MTEQSAGAEQSPQRYELWRPVINAARRRALERIHHEFAAAGSQSLLERVDQTEPLVFESIGLEDFSTFAASGAAALSACFAIDGTSIVGVLALSVELARYLIDARFGPPAGPVAPDTAFSRLETGFLRQALDDLVARLDETYSRAGIGRLRVTRICETSADARPFAPDEGLIIFRFSVGFGLGPDDRALRLAVAANLDLIAAVKEDDAVAHIRRASERVARIAREFPVDVRVVLGTWRAPLREIIPLEPGDSIVLPDGADAWFEARGVRLGKVRVQIDEGRLTATKLARRDADGQR